MDFLAAWRNKPVLVTGGTGFIGRHVLASGLAAGIDVTNLSMQTAAPPGVKHFQADLGDIETLKAFMQRVRPVAILHLAAGGIAYGTGTLSALLTANTLKLEGLLELAAALDPMPQVVLAGSGFEYGLSDYPHSENEPLEPFSPYGVSKAAATLVARFYARKMPITVLRLFSVYGPGEKSPRLAPYIIECVMRGEPVELTQCEQLRDYTYVADVAESFWRALSKAPQPGNLRIINVASGHAVTLREYVETLAAQLRLRGYEPRLHFGAKPYRRDEPMTYLADVSFINKALGWQPSISLQDGLRIMVNKAQGDE